MARGRELPVVQRATEAFAAEIGRGMRRADRMECLLMSGLGPMDAVAAACQMSDMAWGVSYRGAAAMLFGYVRSSILDSSVVLWALGTMVADEHPREVVVWSRRCLDMVWHHAGDGVDRGANLVWTQNVASKRWLEWLGASFGTPVLAGPFGSEFWPFTIERG